MPIYVLRLDNGVTLIGEAASKKKAYNNFLQRRKGEFFRRSIEDEDAKADAQIISVYELPKNSFLSRWRPAQYKEDATSVPGDLKGQLCSSTEMDILGGEYPLIAEVYSDDLSDGEIGSAADTRLRKKLGKAVEEEMSRAS